MTPDMHRERAAALRRVGTERALGLAHNHEMLARIIETRFNGRVVIVAPSLAPEADDLAFRR